MDPSRPHTGSETGGEPIPRLGFDIREISRTHSLLAWLLVALVVIGMVQSRPRPDAPRWSDVDRRWFQRIGAITLVQGGIGYLQYWLGVPVELVAFDLNEGGVLCRRCRTGGSISAPALAIMRDIFGGRLAHALALEESPATHEVGSLATRALEHHIERRLKAVAMFERH